MLSDPALQPDADFEPMISIRSLGKAYRMYQRPFDRFKQALTWGRRQYYHEFWALRDVNFDVYPGEMVGIVGRNGSGKSTLLQIIAGTLAPTAGTVRVADQVAALLELGSGFSPDFTGRENVFFSGALNGLSQRQIQEYFEQIADFADIGVYIDEPLRTYSTGMMVRLAFAVQLFAVRRILIVDEALAVGDEGFQRKCIAALEKFQADGGTILLVTHDTQTVVKMCHRALLLDRGELLAIGTSKPVADVYQKLLYSSPKQQDELRNELRQAAGHAEQIDITAIGKASVTNNRDEPQPQDTKYSNLTALFDPDMSATSETVYGTGEAEIFDVAMFDEHDQPANILASGQACRLRYRVRFKTDAAGVTFGMMLKTKEGVDVAGVSSTHLSNRLDRVMAGQVADVCFKLTLNLAPGTYFLNTGVGCIRQGDEVFLQRRVDVAAIRVIPCDERHVYGLAFVAPKITYTLSSEGVI